MTDDQIIWAATEEGVIKIENNKASVLTDKYNITPRSITYIISQQKSLWIATYGDGVYQYENDIFTRIDDQKELAKTTVLHLFKDKDYIWISTLDKGIAKFSISKRQFNWLTEAEGLCNNHIRCCIKDNCGNYWIGSSGAGLSYYKGQQFVHYNLNNQSKSNLIYSLYNDSENKVWVGNADKGISVKQGEVFTTYNAANGFIDGKIKAIQEIKNHHMLIGTEGVYLFSNNTFKELPEFKSKLIKSFYKDKHQAIWVATAGTGIYKLTFQNNQDSKYSVEHYTTGNNHLLSDRVNCITEDNSGNVWYGTDDKGIGYLQNGIAKSLEFKTDIVRSFAKDKYGNIWAATSNGILCISINNKIYVKSFSTRDGLSSNNLYSIIADNNHIIAGNEKGIDQLTYNNNTLLTAIKHFGFQEGFTGVETTQNAICKDQYGNIWIGTINGLTQYNLNANHLNHVAPILNLNNIRLFYLPIETLKHDSSSSINTFLPISLSHNNNHITFDFLGIYLNNPTKVSYQWKLEGLEKDWSPLSQQESVTYPNLLPGKYTFYVKAINDNGVSSAPLSYSFTIAAPWWKQWWFTILWIAAVTIAFYIFYKWRISRINLKMNEQERKTKEEKNLLELQQKTLRLQMNPHFMFNALNSIQNNISEGNEQTARYYLAKYSKLMRMVLENSRNDLITLEEEVKMLENYLLLEKFSNNDSFDYTINIDESIENQEVLIPPMIIQPFVENAVVHGIKQLQSKGLISISFKLEDDYLTCTIQDNGVGRTHKEDAEHKSTALIVTQERLDLLQENKNHKTIEIIDLLDNFGKPCGTKVIVKITLQLH